MIRRSLPVVLAVAPLVGVLAFLAAPDAGGDYLNWYNVSAGLSVVALGGAILLRRPRPMWPWIVLLASQAVWLLGDLVYTWIGTDPVVSIADIPYVAGYAGIIVAVVGFVRRRLRQRDGDSLLEAAAVGMAATLAIWELILEPGLEVASASAMEQIVTASYPILDAVLIFMVLRLTLAPGRLPRAALFLGAGLVALLVADAVYAVVIQTDSYAAYSTPLDATWLLSYAVFPLAAVHRSATDLMEPAEPSTKFGIGRLLVIGSALVTVPAVDVVARALGEQPEIDSVLLSAVTIIPLVLWRIVRFNRATVRAGDEVARREAYYRQLASNSSDAFIVVDAEGWVLDASDALVALIGFDRDFAVGKNVFGIVHGDDRGIAQRLLNRTLQGPRTVTAELRVMGADGSWPWVEVRSTNLLDDPAVGGIVINAHDVTTRKQVELELEHQAFHDALTGLANRALFKDRIEHALARHRRHGTDVAVLFCDLDGFKTINDSLGHDAGDRLLRVAAARLTSAIRQGDTIARLGGDEFAVLLEGGQRVLDEALVVSDRMLHALSDPIEIDGVPMVVTASIGVAAVSQGALTPDELLRNADTAMYGAKSEGRNGSLVFQPSMLTDALARLELERDLAGAVERGEFVVHFQPVVRLHDGTVAGFEALVRWQHPTRGLLLPGAFIPVAEESGRITEIGEWVLRTACREAAGWQRPDGRDPVRLSVNLSARQLNDPSLVDLVAQALTDSGLPPDLLMLELTESILVDRPGDVADVLTSLKSLGVSIAIDDFGTGYSSLSYLRQFPADVIKIDRSFIESIEDRDRVPAIVRGLLDLARTLDLGTVAEGIEHSVQRTSLVGQGCQFGQGYLFARPIDAAAAAEIAAEHHARTVVSDPDGIAVHGAGR
jgi:diguanylate cyclase (GGDEF)-like protein/PAS domain S-box-containing protein